MSLLEIGLFGEMAAEGDESDDDDCQGRGCEKKVHDGLQVVRLILRRAQVCHQEQIRSCGSMPRIRRGRRYGLVLRFAEGFFWIDAGWRHSPS